MSMMQMTHVYLGLGSNLGDRAAHLREAIHRLGELGAVSGRSNMIETTPWGYLDQPDFLNMVVAMDTAIPPRALLENVKRIEREMGRAPTFRNGPRVIDIDILLYGTAAVEEPGLIIPHPRMTEREFVMGPLRELQQRERAGGSDDADVSL